MAAPREQDQSIKAHKQLLFEPDAPADSGPRRPFAEVLRETPALPLSPAIKGLLWGVGGLVVLLLLLALLRAGRGHQATPAPRAEVDGAATGSGRDRIS